MILSGEQKILTIREPRFEVVRSFFIKLDSYVIIFLEIKYSLTCKTKNTCKLMVIDLCSHTNHFIFLPLFPALTLIILRMKKQLRDYVIICVHLLIHIS